MISSAGLFQTNGLGSSFQCSAQQLDRVDEIVDAGEDAAPQAPFGELREPPLDEVEPRRAGRA